MKTYRYRYTGSIEVLAAGRHVFPGDLVESPAPIRHPHFVPVQANARPQKLRAPFRVYQKPPDTPKEAPLDVDN